jgi:hypothetical protein
MAKSILLLLCFSICFGQVEHRYVNGFLWSTLGNSTATVSVAFADTGKYIIAAILVSNNSQKRFDVLPEQVELAVISGHPPRLLRSISEGEVIRAINTKLAWSALGTALAAQSATRAQTSTSETSGNVSVLGGAGAAMGTFSAATVTTARVPDTAAQREIYENQRQRAAAAKAEAEAVQGAAMRANTVDPGQAYRSIAFFERDKSCGSKTGCTLQLQIVLGESALSVPAELHKP